MKYKGRTAAGKDVMCHILLRILSDFKILVDV